MSHAIASTGRPARSSAVTIPSSGCTGSSGSRHTGTSSGGSSVPDFATTTTSKPAATAAAIGRAISGSPSSWASVFAPRIRRPRPPASTAASALTRR
jgi:hypothetical protein